MCLKDIRVLERLDYIKPLHRALSNSCAVRSVERRSSQPLPNEPVRTRFAPSPTGFLHLGSLRTALFNYLAARKTGGRFILRIEDTDRSRSTSGSENGIIEDLRWAGLDWDEGPDKGGLFGPYRQSERLVLYRHHGQKLIRTGHAYRCFCPAGRLDGLMKAGQAHGVFQQYDRACLGLSEESSEARAREGVPHIVRLKLPDEEPAFEDLTYGRIRGGQTLQHHSNPSRLAGFEDPILIKSDGTPTYHLANVVDDHLMEITHVIRAAEWLSSTPKHIMLYRAFGWTPPVFCHVGLLQSLDGKKLSKRTGSMNIRSLRDSGIFPESLANFCALLGWSHRSSDDFLEMDELIRYFDFKFTRGNSRVDMQKLYFLQSRHAMRFATSAGSRFQQVVDSVNKVASHYLQSHSGTIKDRDEVRSLIETLITTNPEHFTSPEAFFDRHIDLFSTRPRMLWQTIDDELISLDQLREISANFTNLSSAHWTRGHLREALQMVKQRRASKEVTGLERESRRQKVLLQRYLRWALVGGRQGPPLVDTMVHLGRRVTLDRLETAQTEYRERTHQ